MRDYEIVALPMGPASVDAYRVVFENCVYMSAESALPDGVWARSLDPRLIDYQQGVELDGYIWGVKYQILYPGFTLIDSSPLARDWSDRMGFPLQEVEVGTNGHNLRIVFSDLRVEPAPTGYAPFQVPD
jgi:hypothetical protein